MGSPWESTFRRTPFQSAKPSLILLLIIFTSCSPQGLFQVPKQVPSQPEPLHPPLGLTAQLLSVAFSSCDILRSSLLKKCFVFEFSLLLEIFAELKSNVRMKSSLSSKMKKKKVVGDGGVIDSRHRAWVGGQSLSEAAGASQLSHLCWSGFLNAKQSECAVQSAWLRFLFSKGE